MKRVLDLSLRYKIPLWGSLLILVSVMSVSGALMFKAYEDLRRDVRSSAEGLGRTLSKTLFPALLHDDVWHAFEQIHAAFSGHSSGNPVQPEAIFVVDVAGRIIVSSVPTMLPMLARLESLGQDHAQLAAYLGDLQVGDWQVFDFPHAAQSFFAFPIREEGAQVGTLILAYPKDVFLPRFRGLALFGAFVGALVLAVLLPINWFWGVRMSRPLVGLAQRMSRVVHGGTEDQAHVAYPYQDEVGQLFHAYDLMLDELRQKTLLEQELMQSERLSAVGRLASGIAHEINNPLGGMLMALDTLRERGEQSEPVARTAGLLQRGLKQIQDTVGALLVQTRGERRPLKAHDLDDVRTLVHHEIAKKFQQLDWQIDLPPGELPPALACRQIMINLLLNAVQAAPLHGQVAVRLGPHNGGLHVTVVNDAEPIPAQRLAHLFEPFVTDREDGHGLGLWVTYQIVQQLQGRITAMSEDGRVRFEVWLPMEKIA